MAWFNDRWEVLQEAIGLRKFVIFGLLLAVFRGLQWAADEMAGRGMSALGNIPIWYLGSLFSVLLLAYWLLEHSSQQRRDLTPKLVLSFRPERGGIVSTPIKETTRTIRGDGSVVEQNSEYTAVYIRGLATSGSERAVSGCVPFLTGVRKLNRETQQWESKHYFDDIQLPWSLIGNQELTIPKGVRRHFDILDVHERRMRIDPCGVWPLTARGLFADYTKYQVDVVVMGGGISERMTIEFSWAGDLKTITGLQAASQNK